MKVLIVNNMAPFVWGGAEELAVNLKKNLVVAGYQAEILRIPFQMNPPCKIPSQMMMVRGFELQNVDRVIALKFPAYLIRHPHKTLWLLHQYRQAYDLYDAGQSHWPDAKKGQAIRELVHAADQECFDECKKIFTNSAVTKQRLFDYNGYDAEVLLPPLNNPELFTGGEVGEYIFAGGRINTMKRQHLLLEALAKAPPFVKLIIAGPPDTQEDVARLHELAERLRLTDRVKLDMRFLNREELAGYMNNAAAVAYLPYDEDSLGYVAMEAATARKAIITTSDSGGILGLAKHEETGWVAEPNVNALAEVLAAACSDKQQTLSYGLAAYDLWNGMGVTWPKTIERLLS